MAGAATTDARHEFVTANNVGLVQLRTVAVVNESETSRRNKRNGIVNLRRSSSSVSTRSEKTVRPAVTLTKKRSFYRALSGVSFQNSVDPQHVGLDDGFDDDIDGWQMDHGWSRQRFNTTSSTSNRGGPVRVTFVKRPASNSSHNGGSVSNGYPSDDDADEDYDYSLSSMSNSGPAVEGVYDYSKRESSGAPSTPSSTASASPSAVIKVTWHEAPTPNHIYDIPHRAEEPVADDLSCIDLSIFEPSPPRDTAFIASTGQTSAQTVSTTVVTVSTSTTEVNKTTASASAVPGFIYRPPRPERRGQTLRDRLKLPLRKLFHAPQPPAVDYCEDSNSSNDPERGQHQEPTGKEKKKKEKLTTVQKELITWLRPNPPIASRHAAGNRGQ